MGGWRDVCVGSESDGVEEEERETNEWDVRRQKQDIRGGNEVINQRYTDRNHTHTHTRSFLSSFVKTQSDHQVSPFADL